MLRKLIIIVFSIFVASIFFYKTYKVYAQEENGDITEQIKQLEDLGQNNTQCVIGNSCCISELPNIKMPKAREGAPFPLNEIYGVFEGVGNFFLDHTINPAIRHIFMFIGTIFGLVGEVGDRVGTPQSEINPPGDKIGYCLSGEPIWNSYGECTCEGEAHLLSRYCANIKDDNEKKECQDCVSVSSNDVQEANNSEGDRNKIGVWTAIGCVRGDLSTIIREKVFGFGIGLAGIIALFCIIYAAFQLQTSQGSPEKIKKAQELLTSCIMGLMLIIFSAFILRLIGVKILKIPGFG